MGEWLRNARPYLMLLAVQFGSAGMFIFAMDAIKKGMSHYVFIVYRNAIASITLAPFAFVLERIILDQCFALLGMKFTSASFLSAVMNSAPSVTFVMAVILSLRKPENHPRSLLYRLEHMKMKEVACQAKLIGTIVTFGGTLLMALYKGPVISLMKSSTTHAGQPQTLNNPTANHWILGTCFLLIGCAGFSAFYILQTITLRKYPTEMSLATWVCFVGALQSSVVAAIAERHHPHAWAIGWDTRLFAPAYAGVVTSGVQYYIQGMVIKSMGPVIVTAFNPLRMIIITTLACIILSEQLYLGSLRKPENHPRSLLYRLEHMKMKEVACQAKLIGTIVTFGGTLLMALYKGPVISLMKSSTTHAGQPQTLNNPTANHWILGTCFLLIGCAGFSAFYILQTITLRKYPTEMSLATWVCFVGALQSSVVAAIAERHHPHAWAIGWDTRLFAPAYAGVVTSGVQYYIQGMVIKSMGPVIVTAFNPLRMIIITTLACIILSEQLYLGSVIGAIVVVLGLYLVVWGKAKECQRRMPPSPAKDNFPEDQRQLPITAPRNDSNDNKG
ncbi:hypothetical protein LR48_Vigan04g179100 [Vigna angularis]|uniref:EamA domain-containing protein n=1 Tax=Phaseolus angularis TaxID=3914 RepID=A0A0L9UFT8_PHAAN|nr:hypothetical protein LR48_Vigan04g179100 [Vigna angularis]